MVLLSFIYFAFLKSVCGQEGLDQWWYNSGGYDSPASVYLSATSPFYAWFKTGQEQFDAYAPATHVGNINRGFFLHPELNLPAHRAVGSNSDFHTEDLLSSGAFEFTPQAQKFVAKKDHVDAGLAKKVGQIASMPPGVFVQDDGSVLIETSPTQVDPCNPSPCLVLGTSRCVAVSSSTAKCIGPDRKTLEIKWNDPVDESATQFAYDFSYFVDMVVVPSKNYDNSACSITRIDAWSSSGCGVSMSEINDARVSLGNIGKFTAVLESSTDGAVFNDYTYAIYAQRKTGSTDTSVIPESEYNLAYSRLKLKFFSDLNGVPLPEFFYSVPQGSVINTANKKIFFFGCIRPNIIHMGGLDTRGAGFYDTGDKVRGTGIAILDTNVCSALLDVEPAIVPGFQ